MLHISSVQICQLIQFKFHLTDTFNIKQAGTELGQAQLKLRLDFNQIQYTFAFSSFDLIASD